MRQRHHATLAPDTRSEAGGVWSMATDADDPRLVVRRGPRSTTSELSRHGLRARAEIIEAAEKVFGERGYHGASVEEIGAMSGRSGAAVYQYFGNKHEIFHALLAAMNAELAAQARTFPPLKESAVVVAELSEWLERLCDVFDAHRVVIRLWFSGEAAEHKPQTAEVDDFARALGPRLKGLVPAPDRLATALTILGLADRACLLRHEKGLNCERKVIVSGLAEVLHAFLVSSPLSAAGPARGRGTGLDSPSPPLSTEVLSTLRIVPSARAQASVAQILSAAALAFARHGIEGTTLADVAVSAGLKRNSLYKYWQDRNDLLAALEAIARPVMLPQFDQLERLAADDADEESFRAWVRAYVAVFPKHSGVLRCSIDGARPPNLPGLRDEIIQRLRAASRHRVDHDRVDETAMTLFLLGLLIHLPHHVGVFERTAAKGRVEAVIARLMFTTLSSPTHARLQR